MLIIEIPENLFSSPDSELQGTEMLQLPERSAEWDSNGNPLISRTLIHEDSNQQLFPRILIKMHQDSAKISLSSRYLGCLWASQTFHFLGLTFTE